MKLYMRVQHMGPTSGGKITVHHDVMDLDAAERALESIRQYVEMLKEKEANGEILPEFDEPWEVPS